MFLSLKYPFMQYTQKCFAHPPVFQHQSVGYSCRNSMALSSRYKPDGGNLCLIQNLKNYQIMIELIMINETHYRPLMQFTSAVMDSAGELTRAEKKVI
jgi:hypothetical protein